MPSGSWWYHTDEKDFEDGKKRYAEAINNQYAHLRKTVCPLIGKSCIGCDCTSYVEPIPPFKELVEGEMWFERWFAKVSNKSFTEPYTYNYWLARCRKNVFKKTDFIN
jgi:hypothetical protein